MSTDRYQELVAARNVRALSADEKDELLALQGARLKARGEAKLRASRERTAKREAARRMAIGTAVVKAGVSSEDPAHLAAALRYGEALIAAGFATDNDTLLREGAERLTEWLRKAESGEYS